MSTHCGVLSAYHSLTNTCITPPLQVGPQNMCIVHVSLVPVIGVVGEQKTKPTQHSVSVLRSLGLSPNLLACRCQEPLEESVRAKLVGGWWRGVCACAGLLQNCIIHRCVHALVVVCIQGRCLRTLDGERATVRVLQACVRQCAVRIHTASCQ